MSKRGNLAIVAACLVTGSCATGFIEAPREPKQGCLPGELLICPEKHDRPSIDRDDKTVADFGNCYCESVPF